MHYKRSTLYFFIWIQGTWVQMLRTWHVLAPHRHWLQQYEVTFHVHNIQDLFSRFFHNKWSQSQWRMCAKLQQPAAQFSGASAQKECSCVFFTVYIVGPKTYFFGLFLAFCNKFRTRREQLYNSTALLINNLPIYFSAEHSLLCSPPKATLHSTGLLKKFFNSTDFSLCKCYG